MLSGTLTPIASRTLRIALAVKRVGRYFNGLFMDLSFSVGVSLLGRERPRLDAAGRAQSAEAAGDNVDGAACRTRVFNGGSAQLRPFARIDGSAMISAVDRAADTVSQVGCMWVVFVAVHWIFLCGSRMTAGVDPRRRG
jgi:hypothetical protein